MQRLEIVLYSEDNKLQRLLASALGPEYSIFVESGQEDLGRLLSENKCDLVVVDLDSNHACLEERIMFSKAIAASPIPSIVMADDDLRSTAMDLVRMGAYSYCRKPPSIRELKELLQRAHESALSKRRTQLQAVPMAAGHSCDRLIGSSPQMHHVYDLIGRVANLNASVLITGESGTGKELIATAIHKLGSRSSRPFVAICCGAIPETLIEAELFGHVKGAYTGTVGAREGFLEQSQDGTLFLDEIGELSLSTQVKLLRVLQQREFNRLGCSRLLPMRARLLFATHQNLGQMVQEGKFRQDLYYRINVMGIHAPSLQDRPEDIGLLARQFLHKYAELNQNSVMDIEPAAMALLEAYAWPGNVRELENVIQRALIVARDRNILVRDLPRHIQSESVIHIEEYHPGASFERQLRNYKVKLVIEAVRDNNGNKTLAARNLNISRAYLHRLIRLSEPGTFFENSFEELGTA